VNYFLFVQILLSVLVGKTTEFESQMIQGDKHFKTFNNSEAIKHYKRAVELAPKNFEARLKYLRTNNSIGQNLRDQGGDPKDITFYFKQNVDLAEALYHDFPKRAEAAFSLAVAYGNLALYSSTREKVRLSRDIEKTLKRSIELDPKFPYSYLALGVFYREVSNINFLERFFAKLLWGEIPHATIEESEKNFELSLARDPTFLFTHYHYAKTLEQAGKIEEAADQYREVIKRPPTDSGDKFLKEISRNALRDLEVENPSIFADQVR
jgi:tetratricopeptide (TPR) repeat protein